ncbi:MAG: HlyD family efflux transporter periplasmic adaptor subunit [Opitutaceae bacterium]|nr:HlyD family efflux transporter periplasmic adaptor subunit [Opitutaceae bacterium]MBP9911768.1 HlyD family efflux transporter periplasmic adaptor subunit [Opitutaceae bacterium]
MNASPPVPNGSNKTHARRYWARRLPWLGGALLLALIVVGLWPKPLPVETAVVTRGPLVVTVDEEGMTRVKNRYVISSPVAGQLQRINWKPGAIVAAGQTVLAVLETKGADLLDARSEAQAEAQVHAASARLEQAAAQRTQAKAAAKMSDADHQRLQVLFKAGSISPQELDAADTAAITATQGERAAEFAFQIAEFELVQAKAVLLRGQPAGQAARGQPLVIISPVSGRVLRVFQESERVVSGGFPLLEIGDATDLEARIEVLSRDGVAIAPGARVQLEQWGGHQPLGARVRLVEPSAFTKISALGVEEQRVNVIVDLTDPFAQRPTLGDAYRVEARIVTWEGANILKVPSGALFQRGDRWQTFVLDGRTARLRAVQTGHGNGLETEIIAGLREGEQVIVYPGDKIADGVSARVIEVAPH